MLSRSWKFLLDLIEEKENLLIVQENIVSDFDIWMHERILFWALEIRYFFKKIKNKDKLIQEILGILNFVECGFSFLEICILKVKLDIFLKYREIYELID